MKLFSHKGLAAAATAVALSATALTAPAMAQPESDIETSTSVVATTEPTSEPLPEPAVTKTVTATPTATEEPGSSLSSEDVDPGDIKDWVGVFTAVLGGISALFVFLDRYVLES